MAGFIANSICVRIPFTFGFLGYTNPTDTQLRGVTHLFGTDQWDGNTVTYVRGTGNPEVCQVSGIVTPASEMATDGFGRRVWKRFYTEVNPFDKPQ